MSEKKAKREISSISEVKRDRQIVDKHLNGASVGQLMKEHDLSAGDVVAILQKRLEDESLNRE